MVQGDHDFLARLEARPYLADTRALEPRILLDAAGFDTAIEISNEAGSMGQETPLDTATPDVHQIEPLADLFATQPQTASQVLFVDAGVDDPQELISGLPSGTEVVFLDSANDGLAQIAAYLAGRDGIDAIHIVSHGSSGSLELGNGSLTLESMDGEHAGLLAAISTSLSQDADILIYGCNFAAGPMGADAVARLSELTGADIAASDDLTGAAALGGDWDLEVQAGSIETAALAALDFQSVLTIDAQQVANDAFFRGNFVEAGITENGTFGSSSPVPSGYHSSRVPGIFGFIANPQMDNWATYDGDFFSPGTPHEGFTVSVAGTSYLNDTATGAAIPGSITDVRTGVLCGQNAAVVEWTGTVAGLQIQRTFTILENELFILTETRITNITGASINGIYFAAQLDPDNDQTLGGGFATTNIIDSQPGGGSNIASVTASQSANDGSTISLVADDARARAGYGDFLTGDAALLYNGFGALTQTVGSSATVDESISLAFNIGTLGAGETTTINYTYLLAGDPSGAIACLNLPDAQPDGPVDIPHGSTINIDALGNDSDPNGDPVAITHIVDPANPGTLVPISVGSPVTLSTGTIVSLLPDSSFDVTGSFANLGAETFDYVIDDGTSGTAQATVSLNITNTPPALNLDPDNSSGGIDDGGYEVTFTENGAAVSIVDTDMTIVDPDEDIVEIVVTLTNGQIGDMYDFPSLLPGGVTAAVIPIATLTAPGTITITFTGTATTTAADWSAILQAVTFQPSTNDVHNPDPADRNITIEATDSAMASSGVLETLVHVVPVNDPPTLDLDDDNSSGINAGHYQGTYVENAVSAPLSSGVIITDLDDTNFESMVITLTNGQVGDILNVGALPAGISLVGVPPTPLIAPGTITVQLTGSAPLADYQSAIAAVTFSSTSENPLAGVRTVTVTGNDGTDATPTRTAFITVQPVNDAPFPIDPSGDPSTPADAMPAQSGNDGEALTPFDVTPYFNDFDNPVSALSYTLDPTTTPVWMSIDGSGMVTGTPPSDASQNTNATAPGVYEIIVIATDPAGLSGQTTLSFTIANPDPVAVDDTFNLGEDAGTSGNVFAANPLAGDSDPDGDPITLSAVNGNPANVGLAVAGSTGGTFLFATNGDFTFSPNGDFDDLAFSETRDTTVTYSIDDGQGGTDTATVTVTLVGANDAPTVTAPVSDQSADDGATITPIDAGAAFADVDASDSLSLSATGLPSGLSINPSTGVISGTIDASASQNGNTGAPTNGIYTVVVTANDGNGGIVTDSFEFAISNPAPTANDDTFAASEDAPDIARDVLADNGNGVDVDPDGDALTISQVNGDGANIGIAVAGDNGGMFTLDSAGALTFDPSGDFEYLSVGESATTSLTYTLSDGEGGISTATVTYTVNGVNDAPVPVIPGDPTPPADPNNYIPLQLGADSSTVAPLDVTQFFADADANDTLTITMNPASLPLGLSFDGTTISGTLDVAASSGGNDPLGNPGVYLIPVTVDDGNGGIFATTITYQVSNPPPVAQDDVLGGDEDSLTSGDLFADSGNGADFDPDGDSFTVVRVAGSGNVSDLAALADGTGIGPTTVTGSSGGTFVVNANGTYTFDPGADFHDLAVGETRDTQIVYQVDDGQGGTDTALVTFTVTGVNDLPAATNDDIAINENEGSATANIISGDNGNGADSDPDASDILSVAAVNGVPANVSLPVAGDMGGLFTIETNGLLVFVENGDFEDLAASETRVTSVTYLLDDGNGGTATATVSVTVTGTNDLPFPVIPGDPNPPADPNDYIPAQSANDGDTVVPLDLTLYFGDPDASDLLTITVDPADLPPGLSFDGSQISGTLDAAASQGGDPLNPGVYVIAVNVDDGNGGTFSTTLTYTATNLPPIAQDDTLTIDEDTALGGNVLADNGNGIDADTAPDSDPLTVGAVNGDPANVGLAVAGSSGGIFMINTDGSYTFDPGIDFQDLDTGEIRVTSVAYTVSDGNGGSDTANVEVTVSGSNDGPVVIDPANPGDPKDPNVPADPNNVIPDQTGNDLEALSPLDASPYFVDVDGEPLTFSLGASAPSWLVIDPVSGVIGGTPPSDASQNGPGSDGIYPVTIIATDPDGVSVSTTVDFSIANVPVQNIGTLPEQSVTAGYDFELVTASVFNDPDGDVLAYSATGLPDGLSIDPATGLISGTVAQDAVQNAPGGAGEYLVVITVDDGQGGVATTSFAFMVRPLPFVAPFVPDAASLAMRPGDSPGSTPDVGLKVSDGVNGASSLGPDTGLFTDRPVEEAVNGISLLGPSLALDPSGVTVSAAASSGSGDADQSSGFGRLGSGHRYWQGDIDGVAEALGEALRFRTVMTDNGILHAECSGAWAFQGRDGQSLPGWVSRVDGNLLVLVPPAGLTNLELELVGSGQNGESLTVLVRFDLLTGQVELVRAQSAGLGQPVGLTAIIQQLANAERADTLSLYLLGG
ncbi:MAG: DUF4347 domain-containing protein [Rhizobiaceae bacterium]